MSNEQFERDKVCYEQNNQQMRLLSDQMARVPTIAVTITGGLWFAASLTPNVDTYLKFLFLVFAGTVNIGLVLSCFRIRDVIASYFEKIEDFSPENFATGQPLKPVLKIFSQYSMISIYTSLMVVAAIFSFATAFTVYWPFSNKSYGIMFLVVLALLFCLLIFGIIRKNNAKY